MTKQEKDFRDAARRAGVKLRTEICAAELARIVGVDSSTTQRAVNDGSIPARRRHARGHTLIALKDALAYFIGIKAART